MIRLDGQEIPEPYHLRDLNNALSILAPEAVGGAELYTGGFPVEYGDRTGGVLDLTSREPRSRRRLEMGVSLYHLEASGSGRLPSAHGDRGSWLAAVRAGNLELAAKVASLDREPHSPISLARSTSPSVPAGRCAATCFSRKTSSGPSSRAVSVSTPPTRIGTVGSPTDTW